MIKFHALLIIHLFAEMCVAFFLKTTLPLGLKLWKVNTKYVFLYNYFTPFWAAVKIITLRCCGRPDALSPQTAGRRGIMHEVTYST